MRNIKGQNLFEFIIILALIVIVALISLTFLGDEIKDTFSRSKTKYSTYKPFDWNSNSSTGENTTNSPIIAGSLKGTPEKPVKLCSNGKCSIDYGDYVLNGIPEDFGEFIETAGTSAGTDELIAMLEQLEKQVDDPSTTENEAQELKDLANLGHIIADMQKMAEEIALKCGNDQACYEGDVTNHTFDFSSYDVPYDWTYDSFRMDEATHRIGRIGFARSEKVRNADNFENNIPLYPCNAFVDTFDKIVTGDKYSPEIQKITTEIYNVMSTMSEDMSVKATNMNPFQRAPQVYDHFTGEIVKPIDDPSLSVSPDEFARPTTHLVTDITSGLICATGQYDDNGNACN